MTGGPSDSDLLDPIKAELATMEALAKRLADKSKIVAREADVTKGDASDTRDESDELAELIRMAVETARGQFGVNIFIHLPHILGISQFKKDGEGWGVWKIITCFGLDNIIMQVSM